MRGEHTPAESRAAGSGPFRFRLSFLFLLTFASGILFALGRSLGLQFAFYMIGLLGFLAGPAVLNTPSAPAWKRMVALLAAFFWFSCWVALAGWVVRSSA
jgi:hypothetical protein